MLSSPLVLRPDTAGVAELKWRQAGEHVQRAEFDEWLRSPQLERAIAASAARGQVRSGQVYYPAEV